MNLDGLLPLLQSKIFSFIIMKSIESTIGHEQNVSQSNYVEMYNVLQGAMRSALFLVMLSGCNSSIMNKPDPQKQVAVTSNAEVDALQRRLALLEEEAKKRNSNYLLEIQDLQRSLDSKADQENVGTEVRKALRSEQSRIDALHTRSERIDKRLSELEEHLGVIQRIPDAPWYKDDKKDTE